MEKASVYSDAEKLQREGRTKKYVADQVFFLLAGQLTPFITSLWCRLNTLFLLAAGIS